MQILFLLLVADLLCNMTSVMFEISEGKFQTAYFAEDLLDEIRSLV